MYLPLPRQLPHGLKIEMNSVVIKLTFWNQDRSVDVVTCYKLDSLGSIPSPVGALCLRCALVLN
jgi:hypothetical protein